ncbi:heme biosynthesis protein HemY [Palleronia abyssalis]|uniref:Lipopolysaccharide assembly protein B n=1 Tax=Palleronia abyssalis TaxID=1501240 RepID=A0A2R8BSU1_9RHOB|nr:heme biosynthesis HemY N-terminal domain-containing protein [Palleronia abyssalis]SPJ23211.1 Lipopolysaccharide assembly protein B [Palleronia abyssalis]
MLWSLIKVVVFFAVVGLLAIGAGQLLNADGSIRVALANTEFTLGPPQAVIAAVLLVVLVWIVLKVLGFLVALVRFLNGDDTAVSRYFSRNREKKGLNALGDAMLALASGEGREAQAKAERAEKYLQRPELTQLLIAQGAEMTGDHRKAEEVYKQLVQDDRTKFVGVRGLLKQQLEAGNTDTAFALAERAFALKPKHEETQDTLLKLQAARHDWAGARQTLGAKLKHGSMPRDVHKRRDAVLALSEARDITAEDSSIDVREKAIEANRLSPDLIPAAVMAARGYMRNNQERYATRVLKKAWEVQPHPDLAAAFADIQPNESTDQRIRRFTTLTRQHPDHPETKMLLAELHIANEDFPAARRALGDLATANPTARSVTIMAAIERGEGANDAIVRGWLTKALTVPRGPKWVCENCHTIHAEWGPICGNCGAFDTLAWTEPKEGTVALPTQAEMLPLIVGQVEDHSHPEVEDAPGGPATAQPDPAPKDVTTPSADVPPTIEDRRQTSVSVPEAEVIVPQEQRDEQNAKSK